MKYATIIPCPICDGFVTVADDYVCDKCGPAAHVPYWNLSERLAKGRETMLTAMTRLCDRLGVPYDVERPWLGQPHAIAINIKAPSGLAATIDFDGGSCQPNVFVVSWHMMTNSRFDTNIIRSDFAGSRNEYHKRKATDVFRGFEQMIRHMSIRLQRIADGTATEAKESEPAEISGTQTK